MDSVVVLNYLIKPCLPIYVIDYIQIKIPINFNFLRFAYEILIRSIDNMFGYRLLELSTR